MAAHCS